MATKRKKKVTKQVSKSKMDEKIAELPAHLRTAARRAMKSLAGKTRRSWRDASYTPKQRQLSKQLNKAGMPHRYVEEVMKLVIRNGMSCHDALNQPAGKKLLKSA